MRAKDHWIPRAGLLDHRRNGSPPTITVEEVLSISTQQSNSGPRYKLFKKPKEALGQKFFSERVVDLWNDLGDKGPSIKYVTLFWTNFDLPPPCHTSRNPTVK